MPLDLSSALYDYTGEYDRPGYGPEIYKGATYSRVYLFQKADGTAEDLSGYTGTCNFNDDGGTTVFTSTVTITDAAGGEVTVEIPATATAAVTPVFGTSSGSICSPASFESFTDPSEYQELVFDLFMDDGSGTIQNAVKGKARFFGSTHA